MRRRFAPRNEKRAGSFEMNRPYVNQGLNLNRLELNTVGFQGEVVGLAGSVGDRGGLGIVAGVGHDQLFVVGVVGTLGVDIGAGPGVIILLLGGGPEQGTQQQTRVLRGEFEAREIQGPALTEGVSGQANGNTHPWRPRLGFGRRS